MDISNLTHAVDIDDVPHPALIVVTLATLIFVVYHFLKKSATPTTDYFLIGSGFHVFFHWTRFYDWLTDVTRKGKWATWTFSLPFQPKYFIVTDPAICEHMLKTNFDNYEKGRIFRQNFQDFLGDGIFNADGESWRVQRKRASPMFSVNSFKNHMLECFVKHGDLLLSILENTPEGQTVDMNDLFMRYTLDSIGEIGFGYEINSLANPSHVFARSFDFIQYLANVRFFMHPLMKYLNPFEYQVASHIRELDQIAEDCIKKHNENPHQEESKDFLSMFMVHKDNSKQFYKDLIMNFTIAGRDTTGLALSWMFWLLSTHPEVEKKVIEEIEQEIGTGPITYDALNRLRYTEAVFSETLRLYPSVPKDGKMAINDDILPDGTPVPAGSLVIYFPYAMGRREDLWPNPLEFRPERFIEDPKPSPFKFIAFQAGPRTCLGQRMAYVEAKAITAMIYQRGFRLRTQKGFTPEYSVNLTLSMRSGLLMNVQKQRL